MKKAILAVSILTLMTPSGWAAFTSPTNDNGVTWVSASAESWSGSAQTRPSDGAILHLVGAFDTSVDTTNIGGTAKAFLGLLDPIMQLAPDTPTPTETFTFTPTIIPGGPTLTFTPTFTPGGATFTFTPTMTPSGPANTPTMCMGALANADFNLDGINGIDSRDLLLLYAALKDGIGNPYDLDCSGTTDLLDLIRFSQKWEAEIP